MWWKFPEAAFVAGCCKYLCLFLVPAPCKISQWMHASNCNAHCLPGKAKFCRAHIQPVGIKWSYTSGCWWPSQDWPMPGPTSCSVVEFYSWSSPEDPELLLCRHDRECVLSLPAWRWPQNKDRGQRSLLLSVLCAYRERRNGAAIRS